MNVREYIKGHEGFDKYPRKDTDGNWVLGYGHDMNSHPCPEKVAEIWLTEDLEWAEKLVREHVTVFGELSPARQTVLLDMAYNMGDRGPGRGFRSFKKFFSAVNVKDFVNAEAQILDSKYHKDLPTRCERNAMIMGRGTFEDEEYGDT